MKITPTQLEGAFILEPQFAFDERGWFARIFDAGEFAARGLEATFVLHSASFNIRRATLRGLHYQAEPHAETKIVRCTAGAAYDVIVDLRRKSPTFLRHLAVELTAENHLSLYVPHGFAHGFLTLQDATEIAYSISHPYHPDAARGVRWNDPTLGIRWPFTPEVISARDASLPDLESQP